jgi:hypothetical protein
MGFIKSSRGLKAFQPSKSSMSATDAAAGRFKTP